MLIEKVNLVVTDKEGNETSLSYEYKSPSMAVQDELLKLSAKNSDELVKLGNKYQVLETLLKSGVSPENLTAEEYKQLIARQQELIVIRNKYDIEMFKAIVKTNNLTTEQKALFVGDYKSPFWREQDMEAIAEAISSFRIKLRC